MDVQVTTCDALPLGADAFDAIVVHAGDRSLPSLDDPAGVVMLRESYRVLRPGGRILIVEGGPRGIAGLLRPRARLSEPASAAASALTSGGFRATRPLAEREGYRFTEGLK